MPIPTDHPTDSTIRMRRTRQRRRQGEAIATILMPKSALDALVAQGLLAPVDAVDAGAVSVAVGRFLGRALMAGRTA